MAQNMVCDQIGLISQNKAPILEGGRGGDIQPQIGIWSRH